MAGSVNKVLSATAPGPPVRVSLGRVQHWVDCQDPFGDELDLVGPALGDDVRPSINRALGDVQYLGDPRLLAAKVINHVILPHGPRMYSMGYPQVKDATALRAYAIPRMEDMAIRIRQLRIARGLTQLQLAAACKVTKGAVSQWENGMTANVKLQTFMRLCEILGTDPAYLIWGPSRVPAAGTNVNRK